MATSRKQSGKASQDRSTLRREAAVPRPSHAELYAMGKRLRDQVPRAAHAAWKTPADRPEPVRLLEAADKGRIPELVPIRHGRMLKTPFTFYRGAALNMAADLADTPATGLRVQACGDAHLLNFGGFATPERRLIFDLNDLDETLPAPWEWDVKRLAASFVLAARNNSFSAADAREAVLACVQAYRERMAEYSQLPALEVWYASIEPEKLLPTITDAQARKRFQKRLAAARHKTVAEHECPKLAAMAGRVPTIKDNPPLIYHPGKEAGKDLMTRARAAFGAYRASLEDDRRVLLDRYALTDIAIKVVGVGSVGTFCAVGLLMAGDQDPLFLQVKEARASVLEAYAGKSRYPNHGQRVVTGCRLMQAASDVFLGWVEGTLGRHFYVRQLKDMKLGMLVELFTPGVLTQYAAVCGWALARAHARSGAPAQISGYLGKSDAFDQALAQFAVAYADQSERDHAVLKKAAQAGRVQVVMEPD